MPPYRSRGARSHFFLLFLSRTPVTATRSLSPVQSLLFNPFSSFIIIRVHQRTRGVSSDLLYDGRLQSGFEITLLAKKLSCALPCPSATPLTTKERERGLAEGKQEGTKKARAMSDYCSLREKHRKPSEREKDRRKEKHRSIHSFIHSFIHFPE